MATKYVRCDSHCKYPAYSADEVDALISEASEQTKVSIEGKFVTITETITILDGNNNATSVIDFPGGFNKDNCVVISKMLSHDGVSVKRGEAWYETESYWSPYNISVTLGGEDFTYQDIGDKLRITIGKENSGIVSGDYTLEAKVVLMKVGE